MPQTFKQTIKSYKLKNAINQCPSCNLFFNSNGAFSKHRTGRYGVDRRCRTEEEMSEIGMVLNYLDLWCAEAMDPDYEQRKIDAKLGGKTLNL